MAGNDKIEVPLEWYTESRKIKDLVPYDYNPRKLSNDIHPTMKPLDLISRLITNSSRQGEIVLDSFLGGGRTLIAAEKNWRQCRAMELDSLYFHASVLRYIQYIESNGLSFTISVNGEDTNLSNIS